LLFFHVEQLRSVVVELELDTFKPEYAGKLTFYVAAVDALYRREQHAPTVGLLLRPDRNERVVRYALAGHTPTNCSLDLHLRDVAGSRTCAAPDSRRRDRRRRAARGRPRNTAPLDEYPERRHRT
jgi:hypothetical protein